MTPRERAGWSSKSTVAEFGEVVDYILFSSGARAKFDAKLSTGVWLGLDNRNDEHLIGTDRGVFRASIVKGVVADERWNAEMVCLSGS